MSLRKSLIPLHICLVLYLVAPKTHAVINPALQPDVYFSKYDNVLVLEVTSVDTKESKASFKVTETIKGPTPVGETIEVIFTGSLANQVESRHSQGRLVKGNSFPVFAGRPSKRRSSRQVRFYLDEFLVGEVTAPGVFTLGIEQEMESDSQGNKVNTLAGIFNGMSSQLIQMLREMALNTDFYPRKAYVKFKPDILIADLEQSVEGIGIFDINGDGLEDIAAASLGGDRLFIQVEPMVFTDFTKEYGIDTKSASLSFADFDCDGLNDLLLGNTFYRGVFSEKFKLEKGPSLDFSKFGKLKAASFVELNQDGYPDIIASFEGNGLRVFLNPADAQKPFVIVPDHLGLPAKGNGYISVGDWDGDLRTDLFYAEGQGLLFVQNQTGLYEAQEHDIAYLFRTGLDTYGQTGAGVFMPTYDTDKMDLIIPVEKDWIIATNIDDVPTDISMYGNEISEGSDYHLATAYADLNIDGYMDIYTVSDQQKENRYIINRGYGSYMLSKVHVDDKPLFKGPAHGSGGRSLALGDITDDGVPDILIGNSEGKIYLIENDTLSMRVKTDLMKKDESRLMNVRLCSVRVLGPKGVIGARVRLLNSKDEVVIRKDIGVNLTTGCASPDNVCLAVRIPGVYKLKVTYADGYLFESTVDLSNETRVSIVAQRSDQEADDAVW
ncbi:MAG: VCBS repeat-containing protein [Verrucomicrobiota bacterium]